MQCIIFNLLVVQYIIHHDYVQCTLSVANKLEFSCWMHFEHICINSPCDRGKIISLYKNWSICTQHNFGLSCLMLIFKSHNEFEIFQRGQWPVKIKHARDLQNGFEFAFQYLQSPRLSSMSNIMFVCPVSTSHKFNFP